MGNVEGITRGARGRGVVAAIEALTDDHRLGRYELLCPIGRGGMAVVWCARQRGTRGFSKVVALKTMLPMLSSDPRFEKMFLAEAQLASRIKHPNVCETFDLGEDRGVLYLVMEWIDGVPLTTLTHICVANNRDIPREITAWILAKAARGLVAAHELDGGPEAKRGIVHRDVSPQNILVTPTGQVKLVDFGVAKAAERSQHTTESGLIKGKLLYLAPEQIHRKDIDARVDTFALGTLLYEMTTGEHPFRRETDLATLLAVSSPDPIPMPEGDYPAELRAILEKALAKEREERYESMRAFAADLEAYAAANGATEDVVVAFLKSALEDVRAERTNELHAAIREADERNERAASQPELPLATTQSQGGIERPAVDTPSQSRTPMTAVLAVLLGAMVVAWVATSLRARNDQRSTQPVVTATSPVAAPSVSVAATAPATSAAVAIEAPSAAPSAAPVPTTLPANASPRTAAARTTARPSAAPPRDVPAPSSATVDPRPRVESAAEPAAAPTVFHRPGF